MHRDALHSEWNELPVGVTARLVPRFAWQSASIDVTVGDQTILRTGGVYKITGEHSEEFQIKNTRHIAKVSWGKSALRSFPYRLVIDEQTIFDSRVPIQNWWLALWPWAALLFLAAWQLSK